eukprot:7328344-Alexandrium_andersonii.AAC.1
MHDSEHWWPDFFTLACGALSRCDPAARAWIFQAIELDYEQLADIPSRYSNWGAKIKPCLIRAPKKSAQ